ncbi:MAG: V-type proton ATPase subunit E [Oscillospiraceae bacterium]|nr:V-type proton ATPase subunit E [Oscillospiraceae bacterium]
MDANRKLEQFMEAVNRSTGEQIAEAAAHADEEATRILEEAQQRCAAEAEHDLEAAKQRIDMKYRKRLSQVGYRGKTSLLSRRQNMLLSLFAELRTRLNAFTESDGYRDWMVGIIKSRQPETGTVILLREADLPLGETLLTAAGGGVGFRADPMITLGGLSLLSPDGRRCENHTLDEAFSSQLREFYRKHSIGDGGNA